MIAPSFVGVFAHSWTAEVLPNRPMILPSRHYVYPAEVEEVERGALEVLVQPGGFVRSSEGEASGLARSGGELGVSGLGNPFLATCALGFRDPAAPSGLWSMPHPDWLCAVSGGYAYLIHVADPTQFTMVPYRPVLQVMASAEQELLLFLGHQSILAWGRDGERWRSERLSWEGVAVDRIDGDTLHGTGWDLLSDMDVAFALDLKSGMRL